MAEVIVCPCGRAFEVARTDVLESVDCPVCKRELTLDIWMNGQRGRGYLTVVAGPDRLSERIPIPIDEDLKIGSDEVSWLSLADDTVARCHCTVRLRDTGKLSVVAGSGADGQPAFHAELQPSQIMKIGAYQLRLSIESGAPQPQAPRFVASTPPPDLSLSSGLLRSISAAPTLAGRVVRNRFKLARGFTLLCGAIIGVVSAGEAMIRGEYPIYVGVIVFVSVLGIFSATTRQVGLVNTQANLLVFVLFVLAATAGGFLREPLWVAGSAMAAAGIVLTIVRRPNDIAASIGVLFLATGAFTLFLEMIRPGGTLIRM